MTDIQISHAWAAKALDEAPLTPEHLALVARVVYERCDAVDGVADGLIEDPRRCEFDPERDLPRCPEGSDGADCLTAGQVRSLKAVYSGTVSNGRPVFVGQPVGAEKAGTPAGRGTEPVSGWEGWLVSRSGPSTRQGNGETFLRYMAFPKDDPGYDFRTFDFDKDIARVTAIRQVIDAADPDLSAFRARGGRMIMYHGWADAAITPMVSIAYYERVLATMGPSAADFVRLFMVPGMFHCRGGIGVDRLDALTPLINWVENGRPPEVIVGTRAEEGRTVRARPLCPYPQAARYLGTGSIDDAASFRCAAP